MLDLEKSKILIAGDSKENISVLLKFLKEDYHVSYVKSDVEVLEFTTSHSVDLILLSTVIPDMGGYEICKRLKEDHNTCNISIIFLASKNAAQEEVMGLNLGAVDYIFKPFNISTLKARIKNHLALKKTLKQLSEKNERLRKAAILKEDIDKITQHDLKAPLNGVIGLSELGYDYPGLPSDVREYFELILDSGYKMLDLINRSMDMIKMERGTYTVEFTSVDLLKIIQKLVKELNIRISAYKIKINILLDEKPITRNSVFYVKGEELLCYSMLGNIITNAVEASQAEECITILLSHEKDRMTVQVHNETLIPEEIRSTFFEKYVTKGKSQGTGLGAYSAKLIAETLEGDISMSSKKGVGTFIFIHLNTPPF